MRNIIRVRLAFVLSIILVTTNLNLVSPVFAEDEESNVIVDYNFSQMTAPPTHTIGVSAANAGTSDVSLATDGSEKVLKWKRNINVNGEAVNMEIPLTTPITKADFPIEVEYSAKLNSLTATGRGHFGLKGTNATGTEVNSLYGPTKFYSYAPYQFRIISDKAGENFIGYPDINKTKILYNGSPLDSSKYYIHRFIINADGTYTYKIKEDTEGAEWQDIHSDYTLWVLSVDYPASAANAGILPDTITSLYSTGGFFNGGGALNGTQTVDMAKEQIDYFKYLKISKYRLMLEGTNLPEGENPEFEGKNIKLYFNAPVSADTLYNGIELYKDNIAVLQDKYTLSVDEHDASMIKYVSLQTLLNQL